MSLETTPRPFNPHYAIAILALSFSVFLFAQTRAVEGQKEVLNFQIQNTQTQDDNLKKAEKQLKDLSVQREGMVKQSLEIQGKYQAILKDLVELAKDDPEAAEVVKTWKIQNATPPASTPDKPAAK